MLKLETILEKIKDDDFREIFIEADEDFDFNSRNECYLLNEGDMLAYGEKNFTHKLRVSDPIRVAESIYGKTNILGYRRISDVSLFAFDGKKMRQEVNSARAITKSIIKYSLNRIFNIGSTKAPYYFEDDFLYKFSHKMRTIEIDAGSILFGHGASATKMYFIEKGTVKLSQESGNEIALIGKTECFGESAVLQGSSRSLTAEVIEDAKLRVIDAELIESELQEETGLVQVAIFGVLRRLEFMNILRNPSFQNS